MKRKLMILNVFVCLNLLLKPNLSVGQIEEAGYRDFTFEVSCNGFNESEKIFKGIFKIIEHIGIEKSDSMERKKVVIGNYDNQVEFFSYKTNLILDDHSFYMPLPMKIEHNELMKSIISNNKEKIEILEELKISAILNNRNVEFYDERSLNFDQNLPNQKIGKEIQIVKIHFDNELIFHRINENVVFENSAILKNCLDLVKSELKKAGLDIFTDLESKRTSIRYFFEY